MARPNPVGPVIPLVVTGTGGPLTVDVPEGAGFAVFFTSLYGGSPNTLEGLTSNFAGAWTIPTPLPHSNDPSMYGVAIAYAPVTSTGVGKTITPAYTIGNYLGPNAFLVFVDAIDSIDDLDFSQEAFGTATSLLLSTRANDLVLRFEGHYGATAPSLESGFSDISGGVQNAVSELSARMSTADSPGAGTTAFTGQSINYAYIGGIALIGVGDAPTPPVISSPTAAATGANSASGGVTTDKSGGTLRYLASTNASETAATIKAGSGSQAVAASGAQSVVVSGLTASTSGYRIHYVHVHPDGDSNVVSSSTFTTDAPDTTAPTLSAGSAVVKSNALMEVGATTNEANGTMHLVLTTSATPPSASQVRAGQNHAGAAAAFADDQVIGSTGAKTFNATGLTALTGYYPYLVHRDAAGNDSDVMSIGLRTTFRDGATGQYILDNTGPVGGGQAGILYNDVEVGDEDKWFSFEIVTPPATGTLDINPDGTFFFEGSVSASFTYQLEVDGVDVGSPVTVTLYDSTDYRPTSDLTTTGWTSTAGNFFGVLDETPASDADFVTSPALTGTPAPLLMGMNPIPAGTRVARIRARRTEAVGEIRQVFLDASDAEVGATAWLALGSTFQLYEPTVTLSATATKVRLEVRG